MTSIEPLPPRWPWLPFVAPMFAFVALNAMEDMLANRIGYPIAYAIKIGLVTIIAVACRSAWRDLRPMPRPSVLAASVVLGVIVAAAWVGLDGYYPAIPMLGKRTGYDPSMLASSDRAWFLSVRFFGLVMIVPLIEELFWRSFLMRWVIDPNFLEIPVGRVTLKAAALTSIGFMFEHPEWLPALLTGVAWAGLLAWSKSLSACVISHMTANLALGLYVAKMGGEAWKFL